MLEWKRKSLLWLMLSPADSPLLLPLTFTSYSPHACCPIATLLFRAFAQALLSAQNVLPDLCPCVLSPPAGLYSKATFSVNLPRPLCSNKIQSFLPSTPSFCSCIFSIVLSDRWFYVTLFPEYKLQEGKEVYAFCSLYNSQHLDQCLAHQRPSINIC